ncbi:aminoacylase-1-like isoform X1 [Ostrea edulis]|uniref:aminoacylase-1-like isoform X1 n=2 Tax=Ostrea edulis TaxID=37623 RepID=UPI0024AF8A51|nr:aminoacylase-1-like isoform X1 [Ostrea edulis]
MTEEKAVTVFRDYLRIKTVHPVPAYDEVVEFLKNLAQEVGIQCSTVEVHPGRMVVVMTIPGSDPSLPSIMLNSHTDVVPVFEDQWICDPFEAKKMENGDIYARGTQDMKSVGIQYIEAIRKLKKENKANFLRTVHITWIPDEEIGGKLGMAKFVQHEEFKKLNVGFALDEGLANPTEAFTVFNGERTVWWVRVKCPGKPGHGSRFIEDNAAEKVRRVINSFLSFRDEQEKKLKTKGCLRLGDVTTVNLTNLKGGVDGSLNVVPSEMFLGFDIRISPTEKLEDFEAMMKNWMKEAGEDVTYEFLQYNPMQGMTSTDQSSPWWSTFSSVFEKLNFKIEIEIFPAATDIRYLREIGIPALGFSPMNKTPILLHDHNEFLNEKVFLKGVDVYCELIPALANVPRK